MSEAFLLPIGMIYRDDRCWPREGTDNDRVQDFARRYLDEGPAALDPIEVVLTMSGQHLLVNGRHRLAARELIGATDVLTDVLDHGNRNPIEFGYEYALADSARSALPLTRAEKQRAVQRLVTEQTERTDVAIAALVGVSPKTVQRARRWLLEHPDGPQPAPEPPPRPAPTSGEVARVLVRHLDRLWADRSLRMSIGIVETTRLGDEIGEAFVDRVGADQAVVWAERLTTWATRAHAVAVEASQSQA